ncbi:MAG: DNA-binding protein [Chloroflexi bacterium]|jgi:nitroimidazol reductase NimA-like FMN-containing flavoprotein (pyridoxamine 5'-phosphate oxidase superfamily)|nr:DNA-binding protein [Chloroflexota bacterium]
MNPTRMTLAEELTREECLELLQYNSYYGRLGFVLDGRPMVLPVNYLAEETHLLFCTAPGTAVSHAVGTPVAFEVDGSRSLYRSGWSVLVQGFARAVTEPDEVEWLRRGPLKSWAAPGPRLWVRVSIDAISGRRIAGG